MAADSISGVGTADGLSLPPRAVSRGRSGLGDRVYRTLILASVWLVLLLAAGLVAALTWESWAAMRAFGLRFLVTSHWDPVAGEFGALPFIYGTLVSSLLALLIAVPLSLGAAIFLAELAPAWVRPPVAFLIEMLAAVPSVVYGLWGIFVLVPWLRDWVQPALGRSLGFLPLFQGPPYGIGMLAAGLILSIMIVPYITSVSREVLLAVPGSQREAALGLGATRWETTRIAVLRYGRSGLIGAILLGLGRALGETMAVTMVIGNRPEVSISLFAPGYTMASVLANEFTEATSDLYVSALVEIGLLLLVVTVLVNGLARLLVWSVGGPARGARG
ncbi:MAG TPA: phosphate ABC transporter permease subunit PstC [Candidatus Dormibacteraeota bacterium]|nr:phosphate ABC transporter permease subunit PstC [Methylomirabilota bacterium]HWN05363.1 phosphate ABC transporter permease subunit PstC [Candidatus Dormibacteraeota bacterium]